MGNKHIERLTDRTQRGRVIPSNLGPPQGEGEDRWRIVNILLVAAEAGDIMPNDIERKHWIAALERVLAEAVQWLPRSEVVDILDDVRRNVDRL